VTVVLDTSVLSALMRSEREPVRHLLAHQPAEVFLPQPVIAEVRYGLARLPRSKRRDSLLQRATQLFAALPRAEWTDDVSERFGAIKQDLERRGERLEDFDVAIAAHALSLGASLVTHNERHFARVRGLRVETWR
jgi:tRNA(fMet)-specific endonuclease VapC